MTCNTKSHRQTWCSYCEAHPGCPSCTTSDGSMSMCGAVTTTGSRRTRLYWRLVDRETWVFLSDSEIDELERARLEFEATLPEEPIKRSNAMARFYAERDLELLRIHELEAALARNADEIDPDVALELADALREAGFLEAALQTYNYVPSAFTSTDAKVMQTLGMVMLNRGRILEQLGRHWEAETAFAYAQHMHTAAGMLSR